MPDATRILEKAGIEGTEQFPDEVDPLAKELMNVTPSSFSEATKVPAKPESVAWLCQSHEGPASHPAPATLATPYYPTTVTQRRMHSENFRNGFERF